MKKIALLVSAVACVQIVFAAERPYDFRKRLESVHEKGLRFAGAKPAANEFLFSDGAVVAVPVAADDVLANAAKDFCDYLDVSMNVSARFARGGKGTVSVAINGKLPPRSYRIETGGEVRITAADSRAAAQALYHLEDLMNLRRAPFLKKGTETRRSMFSPRMTHSGWGVDVFPDAHLAQIAHAGMDAIVIFVKDVDRTKGAVYQDVNDVIRRAKLHGLDTYLYSYIIAFVHPDDPKAKEVFDSTYGRVAAAYPDAKGIVFVGESCQFPTKDERAQPVTHRNRIPGDKRPVAGWWPCRDYPDWVRAVKKSIDARHPGMDIVFWSYNWGKKPLEPRMELIDNLPKDVTLQATFEMFEPQVKRNGLNAPSADYSLSFEGPGRYFASEAERAHKRGLRLYSMSNTGGLTWDYGVIPYQPCPYQWERRYAGIRKAQSDWGLSGLMECHHYGWWPSFISELEKEAFTEGGIPFEEHLRAIAARDFGTANVERALEAWRLWSDTARDYVASDTNQYGPFRLGPAYPYNFGGKHIETNDFPCPPYASFGVRIARLNYLDLSGYYPERGERKKLNIPEMEKELELLESMHESLARGASIFDSIAAKLPPARAVRARRMAGLGHFMERTVLTAINVKRGAMAHLDGDRAKVLEYAKREYANAKAALPLVAEDSRLGWEPSMEYVGGVEQIRWKLDRMVATYGAEVAGAVVNKLRNPGFASADGIAPDGWAASRAVAMKGAFTCTGGVLRISACAPAYCHGVHQTVDVDGSKSHWFEADVMCDTLMYSANIRYTLLDASGKTVLADRPILHPHFSGPQKKWFRVGLPIPAADADRARRLRISFLVYNNSRKPAEDRALYIRNPSVTEYAGQEYRPLPPPGSRGDGKLPQDPFAGLPTAQRPYQLERGGVGYLNMRSPMIPRGRDTEIAVEAPDGVTYELHLRNVNIIRKLFRRDENPKGCFKLPGSVNWAVGGNTLLFAADDTVPDQFSIKLTFAMGDEKRKMVVPVEVVKAVKGGALPKSRRYRSWAERPLSELDVEHSPLAKALSEYWRGTGWEPATTVNVTGVFPYRDNMSNPLARPGVGPHGTPTGIPCDSDLQAKGAAYYCERLKKAGLAEPLAAAEFAVWDYEPYVVGPVTTGCFCDDCRRAFAKEIGIKATPSSDKILKVHKKEWVHFRCRQRAESVKVAVAGLKMLAPNAKFALCSMPMAPGKGDPQFSDDFDYLDRFGIDSPLYEDFTDVYCSMNYTADLRYFRSLEREMNCLKRPKMTLLENGWGVPRDGKIVGMQLAAAFFAGQKRPYIAQGLDISDGDQLSEMRRAMAFVAETERMWEGAAFRRDKFPCTVKSGDANRFWSMDREGGDGTRYVLAFNCSRTEQLTVEIAPPAGRTGGAQTVVLEPCSYRLLKFR